jgi:hypothetical protein
VIHGDRRFLTVFSPNRNDTFNVMSPLVAVEIKKVPYVVESNIGKPYNEKCGTV